MTADLLQLWLIEDDETQHGYVRTFLLLKIPLISTHSIHFEKALVSFLTGPLTMVFRLKLTHAVESLTYYN